MMKERASVEVENLWQLSAVEAVNAVGSGRIRARDLIESSLERIDRHDGWVRAFITVCAASAREAADAADRAKRAGNARGPLHGLPIAIKDTTLTAGIRTTFGSPIYADHVP
ncbi:MAG: amidase, partial [Xanthobacteraceae bacterium]|nr:amidase [Xanthobacteraceae bacterium]